MWMSARGADGSAGRRIARVMTAVAARRTSPVSRIFVKSTVVTGSASIAAAAPVDPFAAGRGRVMTVMLIASLAWLGRARRFLRARPFWVPGSSLGRWAGLVSAERGV
jgi:hypothetical protein